MFKRCINPVHRIAGQVMVCYHAHYEEVSKEWICVQQRSRCDRRRPIHAQPRDDLYERPPTPACIEYAEKP